MAGGSEGGVNSGERDLDECRRNGVASNNRAIRKEDYDGRGSGLDRIGVNNSVIAHNS